MIRVSADAFDVMAELDRMRSVPDVRCRPFTDEQDKLILAARGSAVSRKVAWDVVKDLWERKWGNSPNSETMRRRLRYLEGRHES